MSDPTAELTLADFAQNDKVLYVPYHAQGDRFHADCERGVVGSVGLEFVFVIFGHGQHPQGCKPDQLVKGWPTSVEETAAIARATWCSKSVLCTLAAGHDGACNEDLPF